MKEAEHEAWVVLYLAARKGCANVLLPGLFKQFSMFSRVDVQRDHFRRKPGGKFDSLTSGVTPAVDWNDDNGRLAETCRSDRNAACREPVYGVVVTAHSGEETNCQRNEEDRNPGAFNEFCDQHDNDGNTSYERAESIDQCTLQPMGSAIFPPVHDHSGLRKREGQESADGIQRNESICNTAKKNEKTATQDRQWTTMP